MLDTLTYANKLKEAGFTERQAQAQAEALVAVVDSNLATKQDLGLLRNDLELLRHDTKHDLELLRNEIKHDLKELELKFEGKFILVNWMLGFILAGTLSIILKIFFKA
jgi:hypothetical protein